ncbi:hypothetical protein [Neisseria gonorrhoeae]|uniref:hypothetical protein n=1 Tax=Neisseria gonorrhoeae TaxID=485 RepID=UPI001249A5DA|nr:hypothetical protein [Neisseria gonorrhoeae]
MPSEAPSFRRHIHKGASAGGEEEGGGGGRRHSVWGREKTIADRGMMIFPKKNPAESIDCFPAGV